MRVSNLSGSKILALSARAMSRLSNSIPTTKMLRDGLYARMVIICSAKPRRRVCKKINAHAVKLKSTLINYLALTRALRARRVRKRA